MHVLSVKIVEEYRTLPEGLNIELKPLTLIVGEQGCGKSSLLSLLRDNSNKLDLQLSDDTIKNSVKTFYFDTEQMNPRMVDPIQTYTNPNGTSKGIGIGAGLASHFKSHGEVLREFTVNRIHETENCVLFLDEPESALSLRNQYKLANELKLAVDRNVQLIISTHCLPLIESVDEVYSLEHKKWMKSEIFIKRSKKI